VIIQEHEDILTIHAMRMRRRHHAEFRRVMQWH
jgi:hypothetical protein